MLFNGETVNDGFTRTYSDLQSAGETKTVTFTLPVEELAFWNIDMQHVVEAGDFNLWVGPNSQEGIESSFVVE